jgi:hypothetical protein
MLSDKEKYREFMSKLMKLRLKFPLRCNRNIACENIYGEDTLNSKKSYAVYDCMGLESSKYCIVSGG